MSADVEIYIRQKYIWAKLPPSVKQVLGESQKEYDKLVINFSVRNQLRFRGNLVRSVKRDERAYYEELLRYSREHLMLYPYHLSDFIVTGMRITPFQYYTSMMQDLMEQEKSYDSLPNFTAADCLRLLGIGRNQYIELMNQCRSSKKFFGVRRKPIRDLLPPKPVSSFLIEPWWIVYVGYVTEDDIKSIPDDEKIIIDKIIDDGPQKAGEHDANNIKGLYRKGLIYLDVPIDNNDYVCVPPLEGFVMNRVLGDYLETLLYKIFVSIDEHTTILELANVLQVDLELVKNAVSMYCRLGFAKKKYQDDINHVHRSWEKNQYTLKLPKTSNEELDETVAKLLKLKDFRVDEFPISETIDQVPSVLSSVVPMKRIGFLFDSTLTAFLMMGNLSPGLKSHAVTMFEVGKLSNESLDSFLAELLKVADVGEGEARRYFDHALSLRDTIDFLRHSDGLIYNSEENVNCLSGCGLDLLRCESLQNLDHETCSRLLNKNYCLLISMAPLTNEIRPVSSCTPPHLGPPISEVSSVWFKLFLYSITKSGPPSLLLTKGTRLRVLPKIFKDHEKLLVTTWAHDPSTVPMLNALPILNDALCHSAVLVQGQGCCADLYYVPFPFQANDSGSQENSFTSHPSVKALMKELDLIHNCGYITMIKVTTSALPQRNINCSISNIKNGIIHSSTVEVQKQDEQIEKLWNCNDTDVIRTTTNKEKIPFALCSNTNSEQFKFSLQDPQKANFQCSKLNNYKEKDWMILDCSFGIPLFNGHLNKEVCQRISTGKLCHSVSLRNLIASNRKLSLQVLQFISNYQPVITNPDSGRHSSFPPNRPGCAVELPLPSVNLFFFDGQLSEWDQK